MINLLLRRQATDGDFCRAVELFQREGRARRDGVRAVTFHLLVRRNRFEPSLRVSAAVRIGRGDAIIPNRSKGNFLRQFRCTAEMIEVEMRSYVMVDPFE